MSRRKKAKTVESIGKPPLEILALSLVREGKPRIKPLGKGRNRSWICERESDLGMFAVGDSPNQAFRNWVDLYCRLLTGWAWL